MSELAKRVLFALVGIPVLVGVILGPNAIFAAGMIIVSVFSLLEYYKLASAKGYFPHRYLGTGLSVAIQVIFYALYSSGYTIESFIVLTAGLLFTSFIIFTVELWTKKTNAIANTAVTLTGLIYIAFSFTSLIALRSFDRFSLWITSSKLAWSEPPLNREAIALASDKELWGYFILILFVSIWICDTAAYFTGRKWGKHKLFPRHSPKKSWEGAIGGFIGAAVAFPAISYFLIPQMPIRHTIISGIIIGIFGQIGDLAESLLKRDAGVKDSSNLLPGHGGVLDRFDSIIFISPLIYLYYLFVFL